MTKINRLVIPRIIGVDTDTTPQIAMNTAMTVTITKIKSTNNSNTTNIFLPPL